MTTTYTVLRTDGDYHWRGLSMEQAADALLSADGRVYSIEFEDGMFAIRRSRFSRNAPDGAGPLHRVWAGGHMLHPTLRALYAAVLSEEWNGLYAMTDAEYDAMMSAPNDHKRAEKPKAERTRAAAIGSALALLVFGAAHGALAQPIDPRCFDETRTMQLYDPACCCASGWCGPIDERFVKEVPGGWQLTIPPGGHVRLQPGTYYVPQDRAQLSPDGRWHACGFLEVRCFLRVGGGV